MNRADHLRRIHINPKLVHFADNMNAETIHAQADEIRRLNALLSERTAVWMEKAVACKKLRRAFEEPEEVIVPTVPADFKATFQPFCESLELVIENRHDFTFLHFLLDSIRTNGESIDFMEAA